MKTMSDYMRIEIHVQVWAVQSVLSFSERVIVRERNGGRCGVDPYVLSCPHRRTDAQLQGLVLCRHLAGLAELLPEPQRQEYMQKCEQLLLGDSQAFQHVGQTLGDMAGQEVLPQELLCLLLTSLHHLFGEGEGKRDVPEPARRGSLWVSLGLLQIQTWLPQARFDPAVKREYKLKYAKEEVWRQGLGFSI